MPLCSVRCRSDKKVVDLSKPMKMGAFVDLNRPRKYSEDDYILPETPPFSWLLRTATTTPSKPEGDANNNNNNTSSSETVVGVAHTGETCNKENETKNVNSGSGGGVVANGKRPLGVSIAPTTEESKVLSGSKPRPSRWSVSPTLDEEKLLKELVSGALRSSAVPEINLTRLLQHFPFATSTTPLGDLAKFYRDCNQAPPLEGLTEDALPEEDSEIDDLTLKLEEFETALPEFDSLVSWCGDSFDEAFAH